MGSVITSGSSFASLRDLSEVGALLCFDDLENIMDQRRADPDKRSLILAGNRRGTTVTLKEPSPDGKTWKTRHVDAFCPRAFSAIRLPDATLASRAVIVPLVRTAEKQKANSDVWDYSLWPYERSGIIDDLWLLALRHLPEIQTLDKKFGESASLIGRTLEPWRAVLVVAQWLTQHGVPGLFERIKKLSQDYQPEREALETSDLTHLVIQWLCRYADNADNAVGNQMGARFVRTSEIVTGVHSLIRESESEMSEEFVTNRSIGRTMSRLRFKPRRTPTAKGWMLNGRLLEDLAVTYGVRQPSRIERHKRHRRHNGTGHKRYARKR